MYNELIIPIIERKGETTMKNNEEKIIEIAQHISEIMEILEIPSNPSTEGTPMRVAKMYVNEVFANRNNANIKEELDDKMKTFPTTNEAPVGYDTDEFIIVKDIPFFSMCEHHFMPFMGKVTVGYVPGDKIIGLSKIPRVVKYFSKKPQLQERLGNEICEYLDNLLDPRALFVRITDCTHTCVTARGIETYCSTDTMASCSAHDYSRYYDDFMKQINR